MIRDLVSFMSYLRSIFFVYTNFFAKILPFPDLRNFSKFFAFSKELKAVYVFSFHGLNLLVWMEVPVLCSFNLRFKFEVEPV